MIEYFAAGVVTGSAPAVVVGFGDTVFRGILSVLIGAGICVFVTSGVQAAVAETSGADGFGKSTVQPHKPTVTDNNTIHINSRFMSVPSPIFSSFDHPSHYHS